MERRYDAIVLGGGPGGYVCAVRLGQLGLKVACVEEEEYGGVCLNWGCIPSKALISTAHLYQKAKGASEQGLSFTGATLDPERMQNWKDGIVKKLTGGVRVLLKGTGVEAVEGRGRLLDANSVEVTKNGEVSRLVAPAIVLATGSATIQVPGFEFDGQRIIGAREAVSLRQVPGRLCVIGGGVIGLELGMVYQSFGSELTVVELTDSLLPGTDPDCVRVVERTITKRGGQVKKQAKAERYEKNADGSLSVHVGLAQGGSESIECDTVLVAVGMRPRSRGIGLEEAGDPHRCPRIRTNRRKVPDQRAERVRDWRSVRRAHARSQSDEGGRGLRRSHRRSPRPPRTGSRYPESFSPSPRSQRWGSPNKPRRARGFQVKVGRFPFAALGRAMSIRETEGFVKFVIDADTKRVLGHSHRGSVGQRPDQRGRACARDGRNRR